MGNESDMPIDRAGWIPHGPEAWPFRYAVLNSDLRKRPEGEEAFVKGMIVRVVMASRFGDLGITRNLDSDHGYQARVWPATLTPIGDYPGAIENYRKAKEVQDAK